MKTEFLAIPKEKLIELEYVAKRFLQVLNEVRLAANGNFTGVEHADRIIQIVSDYFQVDPTYLVSCKSKDDKWTWPRQIIMVFLVRHVGFSYQQAAEAVGRTNHGTAMHACKAVHNRITTNEKWKSDYCEIERRLKK